MLFNFPIHSILLPRATKAHANHHQFRVSFNSTNITQLPFSNHLNSPISAYRDPFIFLLLIYLNCHTAIVVVYSLAVHSDTIKNAIYYTLEAVTRHLFCFCCVSLVVVVEYGKLNRKKTHFLSLQRFWHSFCVCT